MIEIELFDRARVALRHCARMKAGEQVLIVSDGTLSPRIIHAFTAAAHSDGARVCHVVYTPQVYIPMKRFSIFAGMSLDASRSEPPGPVRGALKEADLIVLLSSDLTLYMSQALKEALVMGKRMISSIYITEENLLFLFPESEEEVKDLDELTQAVGKVFEPGGKVRFTSPGGTDFECALGEYGLKCSGGRIREGAPGAGKRFLLNLYRAARSLASLMMERHGGDRPGPKYCLPIRELTEPIRLMVEKGYVREISGGWEAHDLKRFLEELGGGEMYHVTEVGLGTNRRCVRCGVAAPAEDTHAAGGVSFALGCDVHLGGAVRAPAHIDCTTHRGNLWVGGTEIVREGKIIIE